MVMRELIDPSQAETLILGGAVFASLIGAASGYFAIGKRGLCAALVGPLVWVLWQLHKILTAQFGYDSLWLLVGEGVFVVGLGVGLGLLSSKLNSRGGSTPAETSR